MIWMNKQLFVFDPVDGQTQSKMKLFVGTIVHRGTKFREKTQDET